jgi:hypothetical protein
MPVPSSVIKPDKPIFSLSAQRRAITATLDTVSDGVKTDFDATTATWQHKATARISKRGEFVREIVMSDAIYGMLNAGTREHLIFPKNSKILRFTTPFRAKTAPRSISSGPGSKGGNVVWSRGVIHPGTEPREWDTTIATKWQADAPRLFQQAINEATS